MILLDEFDDLLVDIIGFLPYFVIKVGAVERALELLGVHDAQAFLDVSTHFVGSCRREGNDWSVANSVDGGADVAIFRSEIMSPLRNAMSLINGIKRNLDLFEKGDILILVERFWSHIKQFGLPAANIVDDLLNGCLVERGVEVVSQSLLFADAIHHIHLVLHQRDEWRDDNSCAFHNERRQLIAQTFPTACRHQHKRVVSSKQILDDSLLVAFECVKAEVVFKFLCKVNFLCHIWCWVLDNLRKCLVAVEG